jgi:hypothetical protein
VRWFWQKRDASPLLSRPQVGNKRSARSKAAGREVHDPVLAFAREYLRLQGAQARFEGGEILSARLADGATVRYTTVANLARDGITLLAPGAPILEEMLAETRARSRVAALRLTTMADAASVVRAALALTEPGGESPGARLVLPGQTSITSVTKGQERDATAIELVYRLSMQDRDGRIEETLRLAFDTETGMRCAPLSPAQATAAVSTELSPSFDAHMRAAVERADAVLRPALQAAGVFLRQRGGPRYRERIEAASETHERLRRELPDQAREIEMALQRELAALAEIHTVEARASLERISVVSTRLVNVCVRLRGGPELNLAVDVGRGSLIPPTCAACSQATLRGALVENGTIACLACSDGSSAAAGTRDKAGSGASRAKPVEARRSGKRSSEKHDPPDTLEVEHTSAMTPRIWREFVAWSLGEVGYSVVERLTDEEPSVWRATRDAQPVAALALHPTDEWLAEPRAVTTTDVRRAATIASETAGQRSLLVSSALATEAARNAATELGVTLWDSLALRKRLSQLADAPHQEAAQARNDAKERATVAVKTRAHMLKALDGAKAALRVESAPERATGHAALRSAVEELTAVRQSAEQAFLAWDTLIEDWLAAFAERPTRSGALAFAADVEQFGELRDRAGHLGKALKQTFERLACTPADGEMGYDAWRKALVEEYAARLEACRVRVETVDPTAWEDESKARSAEELARAEQAAQAASYAMARSVKAYARVAELVGVTAR